MRRRIAAVAVLASSMIVVTSPPAQAHIVPCVMTVYKPVVVGYGVLRGEVSTKCGLGAFSPGHTWSQTTTAAVQVRTGRTHTLWPFDDPYTWLRVPWPARAYTSSRLLIGAKSVVTCLGGWQVYRTRGTVDLLDAQGAQMRHFYSDSIGTRCGR